MDTLKYFEPKLSGPAAQASPFSADRDESTADDVEGHPDEAEKNETQTDPACLRAADALIAEENANAEFLIGLDGSHDAAAVAKLAAFGSKVQMAEELQKRIIAVEGRVQEASGREGDFTTTME